MVLPKYTIDEMFENDMTFASSEVVDSTELRWADQLFDQLLYLCVFDVTVE